MTVIDDADGRMPREVFRADAGDFAVWASRVTSSRPAPKLFPCVGPHGINLALMRASAPRTVRRGAPMPRLTTLIIAAVGSLVAAGCATMTVGSHVERGLNVGDYRTFDWGLADALPVSDPRLERDPFFQDHLRGAVEKAMAARGFAWSTDEAPDLLLHYHANITERIDIDRLEARYGYCVTDGCSVPTVRYEAGTLVLDVLDARTNRLLWRGWAQHAVSGMLANQDTMARQINEAVARMFAEFPKPL